MTKKMTTNQKGQLPQQRTKWRIVAPASSTLIAIGSFGAMAVFGFSWWLLLTGLGGVTFGLGSFLFHYISSGQYLENQGQLGKKTQRSRLNSLKFKIDDSHQQFIDELLTHLNRAKEIEKHFPLLLKRYFNEKELTYSRYLQVWLESKKAIEEEVERTANFLETGVLVKGENFDVKLRNIFQSSDTKIKEIFESFDNLMLSFNKEKEEVSREFLLSQLEELTKRTQKYLNP